MQWRSGRSDFNGNHAEEPERIGQFQDAPYVPRRHANPRQSNSLHGRNRFFLAITRLIRSACKVGWLTIPSSYVSSTCYWYTRGNVHDASHATLSWGIYLASKEFSPSLVSISDFSTFTTCAAEGP